MNIALQKTATEIAARVRAGDLRAIDVVEDALATIARHDNQLRAFTDVTADRARAKAAEVDANVALGRDPGPLAGVPYAAKNLFDIKGVTTRAGSKINRDNPPAPRDAELIERLDAAGAILLGGLNMGEYAYDFTGENAHDGICRNPHNPEHMSGGSSSGSGSAVAAGMVPLSLGSDTNGSIRVPSALCGIFGLKPTYGRLSRARTFPFCDSLDHLGPLARSTADLALSFDVMQGHDPHDPVSAMKPVLNTRAELSKGANGLRIAIADDYFARGGTAQAHGAVEKAAAALGATKRLTILEAARGRAAAYIITNCESSAFHLERLKTRAADFDPDTRDRFLSGAMVPANWYIRAQRFRRWYHDAVLALFADVDIILAPATPCSAPKVGEKLLDLGGTVVPLRPNLGLYTQPISCIGLPVVVAPIHEAGALPHGVQIIAAPWCEDKALRIAAELERLGLATAPVAKGLVA